MEPERESCIGKGEIKTVGAVGVGVKTGLSEEQHGLMEAGWCRSSMYVLHGTLKDRGQKEVERHCELYFVVPMSLRLQAQEGITTHQIERFTSSGVSTEIQIEKQGPGRTESTAGFTNSLTWRREERKRMEIGATNHACAL